MSRLLPGLPAHSSGVIFVNDVLVKVGETAVRGWDIGDIVSLIKGWFMVRTRPQPLGPRALDDDWHRPIERAWARESAASNKLGLVVCTKASNCRVKHGALACVG